VRAQAGGASPRKGSEEAHARGRTEQRARSPLDALGPSLSLHSWTPDPLFGKALTCDRAAKDLVILDPIEYGKKEG